jgi:hypothetical protein
LANTRVTAEAQLRLKELQTALQSQFGQKATTEDVASALICGITVPQLAGMLIAYNQATADRKKSD